jgi:hypothetical protein
MPKRPEDANAEVIGAALANRVGELPLERAIMSLRIGIVTKAGGDVVVGLRVVRYEHFDGGVVNARRGPKRVRESGGKPAVA